MDPLTDILYTKSEYAPELQAKDDKEKDEEEEEEEEEEEAEEEMTEEEEEVGFYFKLKNLDIGIVGVTIYYSICNLELKNLS